MRVAVLSDIHANLEALEAVIADAEKHKVEDYWFLGDAVGYGPDPVPAVRFVAEQVTEDDWVLGNHDAMVADLLNVDERQATGRSALEVADLHRRQLQQDGDVWEFWRQSFTDERRLPKIKTINGRQHTLSHAGQRDRHILRYIYPWQCEFYLAPEMAWLQEQQDMSELPQVQWQGHTHVPMLVRGEPNGEAFVCQPEWLHPCDTFELDDRLTLINPGSVGQPRDGDRRASYVIFDIAKNQITFRRVPYMWQEPYAKLNELMRLPGEEDQMAMKLDAGIVDNLMQRLETAAPTGNTPQKWYDHFQYAARISCNGQGYV